MKEKREILNITDEEFENIKEILSPVKVKKDLNLFEKVKYIINMEEGKEKRILVQENGFLSEFKIENGKIKRETSIDLSDLLVKPLSFYPEIMLSEDKKTCELNFYKWKGVPNIILDNFIKDNDNKDGNIEYVKDYNLYIYKDKLIIPSPGINLNKGIYYLKKDKEGLKLLWIPQKKVSSKVDIINFFTDLLSSSKFERFLMGAYYNQFYFFDEYLKDYDFPYKYSFLNTKIETNQENIGDVEFILKGLAEKGKLSDYYYNKTYNFFYFLDKEKNIFYFTFNFLKSSSSSYYLYKIPEKYKEEINYKDFAERFFIKFLWKNKVYISDFIIDKKNNLYFLIDMQRNFVKVFDDKKSHIFNIPEEYKNFLYMEKIKEKLFLELEEKFNRRIKSDNISEENNFINNRIIFKQDKYNNKKIEYLLPDDSREEERKYILLNKNDEVAIIYSDFYGARVKKNKKDLKKIKFNIEEMRYSTGLTYSKIDILFKANNEFIIIDNIRGNLKEKIYFNPQKIFDRNKKRFLVFQNKIVIPLNLKDHFYFYNKDTDKRNIIYSFYKISLNELENNIKALIYNPDYRKEREDLKNIYIIDDNLRIFSNIDLLKDLESLTCLSAVTNNLDFIYNKFIKCWYKINWNNNLMYYYKTSEYNPADLLNKNNFIKIELSQNEINNLKYKIGRIKESKKLGLDTYKEERELEELINEIIKKEKYDYKNDEKKENKNNREDKDLIFEV